MENDEIQLLPAEEPSSAEASTMTPARFETKIYEIPVISPSRKPSYQAESAPKRTKMCNLDFHTWLLIHSILVSLLNIPVTIYTAQYYMFIVIPIGYNVLLLIATISKREKVLKAMRVLAWITLIISVLLVLTYPSVESHQRGYFFFYEKYHSAQATHEPVKPFDFHYTLLHIFDAGFIGFLFSIPCVFLIFLFSTQLYLIGKVLEIEKFKKRNSGLFMEKPLYRA